jgi:hypothetical protein
VEPCTPVESVDWWARAVGAAGLLLSLLALGLEYVRHRQARPKVALRLSTKEGRTQHQLKCKLVNSGGSPVGVASWRLESELPDEEHRATVPVGQLMGQSIPALGVLAFTVGVRVHHDALDQVPYRLRIELANGDSIVSGLLTLPVTEPFVR